MFLITKWGKNQYPLGLRIGGWIFREGGERERKGRVEGGEKERERRVKGREGEKGKREREGERLMKREALVDWFVLISSGNSNNYDNSYGKDDNVRSCDDNKSDSNDENSIVIIIMVGMIINNDSSYNNDISDDNDNESNYYNNSNNNVNDSDGIDRG